MCKKVDPVLFYFYLSTDCLYKSIYVRVRSLLWSLNTNMLSKFKKVDAIFFWPIAFQIVVCSDLIITEHEPVVKKKKMDAISILFVWLIALKIDIFSVVDHWTRSVVKIARRTPRHQGEMSYEPVNPLAPKTFKLELTCLEVEGIWLMRTGSICIASSSILCSNVGVRGDIWL